MRGWNLYFPPPAPSPRHRRGGALTVDTELDSVLLGQRPLALAQEDALVMGRDVCQGQSGPSVLQAEPVLVLPRLALALALAHAEDERRLLLVDLRGCVSELVRGLGRQAGYSLPPCHPLRGPHTHRKPVHVAEVAGGMGRTALQKRCAPHFHLHQLRRGGLHLSGHTWGCRRDIPAAVSAPAALHALPSHPLPCSCSSCHLGPEGALSS